MRHLNISSVIDKSKLASREAFVPLFYVRIDYEGKLHELRFCRWSEDITFQGKTYVAADFNFDIENDANEMPTAKLSGYDSTGHVHRLLEQTHGGTGATVKIIVVNTATLGKKAEFEETFMVNGTSAKDGQVEFALAMPNYASMRFPRRIMMSRFCSWVYKTAECGYEGTKPSCDYSLHGTNGCVAHNNAVNFGGFPSIPAV